MNILIYHFLLSGDITSDMSDTSTTEARLVPSQSEEDSVDRLHMDIDTLRNLINIRETDIVML